MDLTYNSQQDNMSIPAVYIGQSDGILLWDKYVWTSGDYVVITEERAKMTVAWELILVLIPVSIVVIPLAAIIIVTLVSSSASSAKMFFILTREQLQCRVTSISPPPPRKLANTKLEQYALMKVE